LQEELQAGRCSAPPNQANEMLQPSSEPRGVKRHIVVDIATLGADDNVSGLS
jgi:hypothetical protein